MEVVESLQVAANTAIFPDEHFSSFLDRTIESILSPDKRHVISGKTGIYVNKSLLHLLSLTHFLGPRPAHCPVIDR